MGKPRLANAILEGRQSTRPFVYRFRYDCGCVGWVVAVENGGHSQGICQEWPSWDEALAEAQVWAQYPGSELEVAMLRLVNHGQTAERWTHPGGIEGLTEE